MTRLLIIVLGASVIGGLHSVSGGEMPSNTGTTNSKPTTTGTTATTSTRAVPSSKRQKWVVKRVRRLEFKQDLDKLLISGGRPSKEVGRQMIASRVEYLILRKELGKITQKEKAELDWILTEFYGVRRPGY
jgi:hypothetical protein